MSASEIDSKRPIASASVMASIAGFGEVGGDRARPSWLRPSPNRPSPGTSTTRGSGSSIVLGAADARVVAREIVLVAVDECVAAACARPCAKSSSLPASGAGTISGQFLVRMVWSGVTTPAWL